MVDIPPVPATQVALSKASSNGAAQALAATLGLRVGEVGQANVISQTALSKAEQAYLKQQFEQSQLSSNGRMPNLLDKMAGMKAQSTHLLEVSINHKTVHLLSKESLATGVAIALKVRADGVLQAVLTVDQPGLGKPSTSQTSASTPAPSPRTIGAQGATLKATTPALSLKSSQPQPSPPGASGQGQGLATSGGETKALAATAANVLARPTSSTLGPSSDPLMTQTARSDHRVKSQLEQQYSVPKARMNPLPALESTAENTLSKATQTQLQTLRLALDTLPKSSRSMGALQAELQALPARLSASLKAQLPALFKALQSLVRVNTVTLDVQQLIKNPGPNLRQAVEGSGVFTERYLTQQSREASNPLTENTDRKLLLLEAQSQLTQVRPLVTRAEISADKTLLDQLLQLFTKFHHAREQHQSSSPSQHLKDWVEALRSQVSQIQGHQYRSTLSQLTEPLHQQPAVFLELPIRHFHGLGNLFLMFQTTNEDKEDAKKRKKSRKAVQQWRVFMELELDASNTLAVDLTLADTRLNAQLWTDSKTLHHDANQHLHTLRQQLEDQGLTVTSLLCEQSDAPPKRAADMQVSTIDIRT